MLERRLEELLAARTARESAPKSIDRKSTSTGMNARSEFFASNEHQSAGPSRPATEHRYPTPLTTGPSGRVQANGQYSVHHSSDTNMDNGRPLPVHNIVSDDEDEEIPLAQLRGFPSRPRPRVRAADDHDIAMAEQDEAGPSTPSAFQRGLAELDDIPADALFSSPPPVPIPRPQNLSQNVRVSDSATRPLAGKSVQPKMSSGSLARSMALGGPQPAISSSPDGASETTVPDTIHPWSKEIKQRLKQTFRLSGFRKHQREAVDATMAGKDGEQTAHPHAKIG
jgi:bloom syndrome protein